LFVSYHRAQQTTARPILTRRGLAQGSAFRGPIASENFQGVHYPQNSSYLSREKGFPAYNITMNNISTVRAISAQISSIGEAWQKLQRNHQNFGLGVTLLEKRPEWGFQAKTL
jgi:hypothetical protein